VDDRELLAEQFEEHRTRLRSVAYRMLGSMSETDDAVQEAWLRLSRTDARAVENLGGWLTTVVARVCLDMLRSRRSRPEPCAGTSFPDPIVQEPGPEEEALMADAVGLALLVVLDTLTPAERLAFVLHDMFAVPFEEIAPIVGRTPVAARQLASRARRRVQEGSPEPDADPAQQRRLVDAFLAASRSGDFEALLEVLDPDVVFRVDVGPDSPLARPPIEGAEAVARQILARGSRFAPLGRPALVNGTPGIVVGRGPTPIAVVGFTVRGGRIATIDLIADQTKLARLGLGGAQPYD
jgi:RNA polymerase sigma factor (sigma-70 family)